ncbi:MAG: carboxypeptidase regulatory-like domain-containing protein, partial [Treponema sp.]|nr:carboxypeptidase regulatory-like domain-containing protein [Treponema sp.]
MKRTWVFGIAALFLVLGTCDNVMAPDIPPRPESGAGAGSAAPGPDGIVHVTDISLDTITLALTTATPSQQLTVTVNPSTAANQAVTYTSLNEGVAIVGSTGMVTAQGIGSTVIVVTSVDGNKTAFCAVSVSATGLGNAYNITATPSGGQVILNWTNPSAANFKQIEITPNPAHGNMSSPPIIIPKTASPNNSFTATGLTNGTNYVFTIRARYEDTTVSPDTSVQAVPTVLVPLSEQDITYLVTAPAKAANPQTMTNTTSSVYQSVTINWKKGAAAHSGAFQAGTVYTAVMTLGAKSGYTFSGLPANSLTHTYGTVSHLAGTGTSLYVEITFSTTDPAVVSGTVSDHWANQSTPPALEGATVELTDSGGTVVSATTSGTDGSYSFTNVAGGAYTIAVSKADYSPVSLALFTVAAADVAGKNARMRKQVTDFDLSGLIPAPVTGMTKPTAIAAQGQYTGTISWSPSGSNPCTEGTVYTATLNLNAAAGWSFAGLGANLFSCSGVTSIANPAKGPGTGLETDTGSTGIAVTIVYPPAQTLTAPPLNTSTYGGLELTLDHIKTIGVEYTNYEINVDTGNESMAPYELWATATPNLKNVTITLRAALPVEISLSSNGSLFSLRGQNSTGRVKLVLDQNITLKGKTGNNVALVSLGEYADLVMNAGSKITGSSGGGVYVSSGTFTMNGGEISGNTSGGGGGGIYFSSSSFTMNGGEISGNTSSSGGGVYVSSGTFTMNGGEISGNTVTSSSGGGGIYFSSSSFTMNGGEISGNTVTSGGGGIYFSSSSFTMNC